MISFWTKLTAALKKMPSQLWFGILVLGAVGYYLYSLKSNHKHKEALLKKSDDVRTRYYNQRDELYHATAIERRELDIRYEKELEELQDEWKDLQTADTPIKIAEQWNKYLAQKRGNKNG